MTTPTRDEWKPYMPLRADATDVQIVQRESWLYDREREYEGGDSKVALDSTTVAVARELASVSRAEERALWLESVASRDRQIASVRPAAPTREQVEQLRRWYNDGDGIMTSLEASDPLVGMADYLDRDAVLALFPPPGATPTTETP